MPKLHFQNFDEQIVKMIKHPLGKLPEITESDFFNSPIPITGMYLIRNSEGVLFLPSEEDYTLLSTVSEDDTQYHSMAIAMRNTKNFPNSSDVFITHAIYLKDQSSGKAFTPPKPSDWTPIGEKIEVVANLDSNSDLKALSASMGLKIKSHLSQIGTFDTSGNFTLNPVVKTINSQSPDANGNIQIEIGTMDAYTKTETDTLVSALQTNIDTHANNNDVHTTLADKTKLDGIQDGANNYTLPIATDAELGGVKVDNDSLTIEMDGTIKAKVSPSNISGMIKKVNNKLPNVDGEVVLVANDLDVYNKTEINAELEKKLDKTDIVDNLITNDSTKTLSAAQGKNIQDFLESHKQAINKMAGDLWSIMNNHGASDEYGLVKIDDKTIKTNNYGQLYVVSQELEVPKWEKIDYGLVAYGLFNREIQAYNHEGAWFRLGLGNVKNERRYQIDLKFTPVGTQNPNLILNDYDMSIGFEVDANGVFRNGRYHSQTPTFDLADLMISINEIDGEYFLAIRLSKTTSLTDSAMLLCSVDKFVIKGIDGKTAYLDEVQNLNYSIGDDTIVAGVNPKLTITNHSKLGSMDLSIVNHEGAIINPEFNTSGYYMIQSLTPRAGDDFTEPIMCIIRLSRGTDNADGTVMRYWTAYEVTVDDTVQPMATTFLNTYHMMDGVYQGQHIARGNWKKVNGKELKKLQTDIQTLFTGWANEISRASVALTRLHVPTATDATMKTVVDNIEKVQVGKRVFIGKTKSTTATSFYQYGYNGSTVNNVTCSAIDTTAIPFDIGMIYIGSNQTGWGAVIYVKEGDTVVVSRSIPNTTTMNDFTWKVSNTGSIPKTTEFKIPTNYSSEYDFIAYEK